jgi:hypothetical protein
MKLKEEAVALAASSSIPSSALDAVWPCGKVDEAGAVVLAGTVKEKLVGETAAVVVTATFATPVASAALVVGSLNEKDGWEVAVAAVAVVVVAVPKVDVFVVGAVAVVAMGAVVVVVGVPNNGVGAVVADCAEGIVLTLAGDVQMGIDWDVAVVEVVIAGALVPMLAVGNNGVLVVVVATVAVIGAVVALKRGADTAGFVTSTAGCTAATEAAGVDVGVGTPNRGASGFVSWIEATGVVLWVFGGRAPMDWAVCGAIFCKDAEGTVGVFLCSSVSGAAAGTIGEMGTLTLPIGVPKTEAVAFWVPLGVENDKGERGGTVWLRPNVFSISDGCRHEDMSGDWVATDTNRGLVIGVNAWCVRAVTGVLCVTSAVFGGVFIVGGIETVGSTFLKSEPFWQWFYSPNCFTNRRY